MSMLCRRGEALALAQPSPDTTVQRQVIDIFLQPGEFYFGDEDTRIRTVLGSCVAITLWHPVRRIGGMCHYMLPGRTARREAELDGRYADEALALFMREIGRAGTSSTQYEVKLFGGGNMFPQMRRAGVPEVGARNVEQGLRLLDAFGFRVKSKHLAGSGHRNVVFELWSGDVWLRHSDAPRGQ